jgi:hypothetical protein
MARQRLSRFIAQKEDGDGLAAQAARRRWRGSDGRNDRKGQGVQPFDFRSDCGHMAQRRGLAPKWGAGLRYLHFGFPLPELHLKARRFSFPGIRRRVFSFVRLP